MFVVEVADHGMVAVLVDLAVLYMVALLFSKYHYDVMIMAMMNYWHLKHYVLVDDIVF